MSVREIIKKLDLPPLSSPISEDFMRRACITKVIDSSELRAQYVIAGYLYVSVADNNREERDIFLSKVEIDLKYGTVLWRDDLGGIRGQCLFEHVSRIVPGVLKEVGGEKVRR